MGDAAVRESFVGGVNPLELAVKIHGNDLAGWRRFIPPALNRDIRPSNPLEKNVEGHDESHSAHRDVHLTVPDFVLGHTFHENRQGSGGHSRLQVSVPSSRLYGLLSITFVNARTAFIAQRLTGIFSTRSIA